MNVLSLFDGISAGRLALERAGIKADNYFASEIDKYAMATSKKNWPDIIQLGDVRNIKGCDLPKIDLLIGGSPCFVEGTKVLTKHRYKEIQEIQKGDEVYTHQNRFRPVILTGNSIKDTIIVKAQGMLPTETTDNHPYYVKESYRKNGKRYLKENTIWKEAGNLQKGDFLALPIIKEEKDPYDLTLDECVVIGRYIADGHTRKDLKPNKNRYYQLILSIGEGKSFKSSLHYSFYKHTKNVHRMVFSNKRLVEIVEKECGSGALNKKISNVLLNLPIKKLKHILNGLFAGDGNFRKNGYVRLTTVSKELAQSLCLAIAKVYNVAASIEFCIRPETAVIESRVINQHNTYVISYKLNTARHNYFVENDFIWLPVKNIEKTNRKEVVYNLEVAEDNSYSANNVIVHNCQGFSIAGKQLNFNDPQSVLFFEYVRLLKECNPEYFLLENVVMKKEYQQVITGHLGVEPIMINSALMSAQNRKRLYWTNIPGVKQPEDKNILLKDIIENGYVDREKSLCLSASTGGPSLREYYELGKKQIVLTDKSQTVLSTIYKENAKSRIKRRKQGLLIGCIEAGTADIKGNDILKRVYSIEGKSPTLTAVCGGNQEKKITVDNITWRKLTPIECERLQTFPDNYTEGVSNTQRYRQLGNSWTVDVIAHIFKTLITQE